MPVSYMNNRLQLLVYIHNYTLHLIITVMNKILSIPVELLFKGALIIIQGVFDIWVKVKEEHDNKLRDRAKTE
jgi:hypothetical protein